MGACGGGPVSGGGRLGYFAAFDLTAMAEAGWDAGVTVRARFVVPVGRYSQSVRFGPIYRSGRSALREFFQHREAGWGPGLWIDI